MATAKFEMYKTKAALKKHEKAEPAAKKKMEKAAGTKHTVAKKK
jgi:hypothetical protein